MARDRVMSSPDMAQVQCVTQNKKLSGYFVILGKNSGIMPRTKQTESGQWGVTESHSYMICCAHWSLTSLLFLTTLVWATQLARGVERRISQLNTLERTSYHHSNKDHCNFIFSKFYISFPERRRNLVTADTPGNGKRPLRPTTVQSDLAWRERGVTRPPPSPGPQCTTARRAASSPPWRQRLRTVSRTTVSPVMMRRTVS